jgi:hypothetical protein
LEGRFFFSSVCGVESGLFRMDTGLSMGGKRRFIFLSANRKAQVRGA